MATTHDGPIPRRPDWRDPANYEYTRDLTREGWAWELLRRNPKYRRAWDVHAGSGAITVRSLTGNVDVIDAPLASPSERQTWGLIAFEDPAQPATAARVFWSAEASSFVLPVHAVQKFSDHRALPFDFSALRCRVALLESSDVEQHVLFWAGGRRLQIAVTGVGVLGGAWMLANVIVASGLLERRLELLRRLSDLAKTGTLPPRLCHPMPNSRRLQVLLQALDGALTGASQREIAIAVLGIERVKADWAHPSDSMRNFVRAAVRRGTALMKGGYRKLLQ
jgi:hypothetical protein